MVLSEIAGSKEYSMVRPLQEKRDERWCHVLEYPDSSCLWIDPGATLRL